MKKIAILVASVLVLGGFGSNRAFAAGTDTQAAQTIQSTENTQAIQTTQTSDASISYKGEAGITPDSLLYSIDKAIDQLRLMLANSEERKAEINTEIAQERLGESEVMTEKGKIELAKKALEEYNEKITDAAQKLQEVIVKLDGAAAESSDEAVDEKTDEKLEQSISSLEKAVQAVQEKSLVVLDSLKDVSAEGSADVVEKVIEEQKNHKEAVANFVKERHEFNEVKKLLNMARVELKKVEKGGSDADVKAAQDKLAIAQNEYTKAQTELHAAFQIKKSADFGRVDNREEVVPISSEQAAVTVENKQTAESAVITEENKQAEEGVVTATEVTTTGTAITQTDDYTKTNKGNGNRNKSAKIEKEKKDNEKKDYDKKDKDNEKPMPGRLGEVHGKQGQANGKDK